MSAHLMGSATQRSVGKLGRVVAVNRSMTTAERLALYQGSVAEADLYGSQVATWTSNFATADGFVTLSGATGTLTANVDGVSDGSISKDNCLRMEKAGVVGGFATVKTTGVLFTSLKNCWFSASVYVPAGQTYTDGFIITRGSAISAETTIFDGTGRNGEWVDVSGIARYVSTATFPAEVYIHALDGSSTTISASAVGELFYVTNASIGRAGITADYQPGGIQLAPGQWLDAANSRGVLLPDGARTERFKIQGQLRSTNTWAVSTTGDYVGGANQIVLPLNAGITLRAKATASGTFNIGDGVDVDRYAAGVTIGTSWADIALITPFHDGANRKIVLTPTASYSGTVTSAVKVEVME